MAHADAQLGPKLRIPLAYAINVIDLRTIDKTVLTIQWPPVSNGLSLDAYSEATLAYAVYADAALTQLVTTGTVLPPFFGGQVTLTTQVELSARLTQATYYVTASFDGVVAVDGVSPTLVAFNEREPSINWFVFAAIALPLFLLFVLPIFRP